jgi:hypothetical protein
MPYTLWHSGVLIGETDFEGDDSENLRGRRHLAGAFRPTPYGRELLPRLCGMLTAAADLKEELVRRGLDADDAAPDEIEDLFETTTAGAHIVDIGRVLSEIELRAPSGGTLEVVSMGFLDLGELSRLSRRLDCEEPPVQDEVPVMLPSHVPEFLVSVTLRERARMNLLGGRWQPPPPVS